MNRLIKLFLLQTIVVTVVAIPVFFYLRSDYREFEAKKQLASQVPVSIGAVCHDGWYSGSTGRGTCSHHGGVKYWGTELRRITNTSWTTDNSLLFVILGAGVIGWYVYGVRVARYRNSEANKLSASNQLRQQCCIDSLAEGLRSCAVCGTALGINATEGHAPAVSPSIAYALIIATVFLSITLTVVALLYFQTQQNDQAVATLPVVATSPSPSPSPALSSTPTPTPKPTPTTKPKDDLDADYVEQTDSPEEAVRAAKEKPTPTPTLDPYLASRPARVVNSPTPRPTTYQESLLYASDVLSAGYSKPEDRRLYRFHLSQQARVKGSFSAHGNISVYIVGGYYSSDGAISSDSIDVALPAGTYEVVVSSREIVGFSLHLTAYYNQ